MASSLIGTWEMISDTAIGVAMIGESHYSAIRMSKDRNKTEAEGDMSPEALMEEHENAGGQAGSYTVSGSQVTFTREICVRAAHIGLSDIFEFSVDGDRLAMTGVSGPFDGITLNFKKVE